MKLLVKRILFCAIIVTGLFSVVVFKTPIHTQSDLMSLLNTNEISQEWPVNKISNKFSSVANIIVESKNENIATNTANKIIRDINTDDFNTLHIQSSNFSLKSFTKDLIPFKNGLISARYKTLLHNGATRQIANNQIKQISESMIPPLISLRDDPFGLLSDYIMNIGNTNTTWTLNNGLLWQNIDGVHYFMIPIDTDDSNATLCANQINLLRNKLKAYNNENITVHFSGVPLHTAIMVQKSQIEMGIISFLALFAAILLNYLLFKKLFTLIPVISSLSIGFLCGTIALFLCFNTPHILTFVFGTTLIGLGIDYAFHFLSASGLKDQKQIHKNMLHSFLTTIVCFLPLLFSQISLLKQISVFTITGLTAIYTGLMLFMPNKLKIKTKPMKMPFVLTKKTKFIIASILGIFIIGTLPFVRIENNMQQLYRPDSQIATEDAFFQKLNKSNKSKIMLIRGQTIDEILTHEEELKSNGVQFFSVSNIIPSKSTQIENTELVKQIYAKESKYLQKQLELKNKPNFVESDILTFDRIQSEFLNNWLNKLIYKDGDYIYSIAQISPDTQINDVNVKVVSPSDILNQYINQYSQETYYLLIICTICLIALLSVIYKKRAIIYLVPSILGILLAISILTIFNQPITFFHMLSFFIVIGLGLDYTIFNINTNNDVEMRPVLFSFLTSFIGFGLLAFTSFFLIKSMGITIGLGLGLSYLISLLLFRHPTRTHRNSRK